MKMNIIRRVCSTCGGRNIQRGSLASMIELLPARSRVSAAEGIAYFGNSARAWFCHRCSTLGVFI